MSSLGRIEWVVSRLPLAAQFGLFSRRAGSRGPMERPRRPPVRRSLSPVSSHLTAPTFSRLLG